MLLTAWHKFFSSFLFFSRNETTTEGSDSVLQRLSDNHGEVAEWSKAAALGAALFGGVGSNPILVKLELDKQSDHSFLIIAFPQKKIVSCSPYEPKSNEYHFPTTISSVYFRLGRGDWRRGDIKYSRSGVVGCSQEEKASKKISLKGALLRNHHVIFCCWITFHALQFHAMRSICVR